MLCCWEFFSKRPKDYRVAYITLTEECFDEGPTKQTKNRIWIVKSSDHPGMSSEKRHFFQKVDCGLKEQRGDYWKKGLEGFIWWHCSFSYWSWGQMSGGVLGNKAHADTVCSLEGVGRKKYKRSGYCFLVLFLLSSWNNRWRFCE